MNDEARDKRSSSLTVIAVVMAVLLFLLSCYVGGYFWLSGGAAVVVQLEGEGLPVDVLYRPFPHKAWTILFWPASKVEEFWTGQKVYLGESFFFTF